MLSWDGAEDTFFDAIENIDTTVDCSSSEDNFVEIDEVGFNKYGYEIWTRELISIEERRKKFMGEMGFHALIQCPSYCSLASDLSEEGMSWEGIVKDSDADLDILSSLDDEEAENVVSRIRDLDSERRFGCHGIEQNGSSCVLNEIGYDKLMSLQEVEMLKGRDYSVQNLLKKQNLCQGTKPDSCLEQKDRKLLRWWRSFKMGTENSKSFKNQPSVTKSELPRLIKRKIRKQSRRCREVTAVYTGQEIKAHKGLIRTMKFSSSGRYLASGGDDCIVLIWQISEVESCCSCFFKSSAKLASDVQDKKIWGNNSCHSDSILIPQRFLKIDEIPIQTLVGHTSDILDLSWSNSNMLLTSSKDNTVRMWKVGHDGCLKVFQHSEYVTCVHFNPMDSRYFISGSIDGKVRIWGLTDSRVVEWVDIREIVTSLCHRPDGKGFVVGSISGNCQYYDYSVSSLQLNLKLSVQSKRKSSAKSVTGLQCFSENSRTVVTSANSRIQILDGTETVLKLKGRKRVKSQFSASLSFDGKHIISVGDDYHVYIWNYDESNQTSSKGAKSAHFCESFLSEGASVAVPWCGMRLEEEVLGGHNNLVSSLPAKVLKPSGRLGDAGYLSCGGWLFSDVASRVSATWPEENLHSTTEFPLQAETCHNVHHHNEYYPSVKSVALTWNQAILTGGIDGTIKTFHYCGCQLGCK